MATIRLTIRVMDTDNGGIGWGSPQKIEIEAEEGEEPEAIAAKINQAQAQAIGFTAPDEQAGGEVVRAAGNEYHGIAWIDDRGHQGATSLIMEWHAA